MKAIELLLFAVLTTNSHASINQADIVRDAVAATEKVMPQLQNGFTGSNATKIQEMMGYKAGCTAELEGLTAEQSNSQGEAKHQVTYDNANEYKCTEKQCELGHTFSTSANLKREGAMEEFGFIKDEKGFPINNKGYLDKMMHTAKDSKNKFNFLTGEYKDCKTSETIKMCEQFYDKWQSGCEPVEINSKYIYECSKRREIKNKLCIRTLKVACKEKTYEPFSFAEFATYSNYESNYQFIPPKISGANLNVCNVNGGNEVSTGSCTTYKTSFNVNIHNLNDLGFFQISKVNIDDDLRLYVNENEVYRTPLFGSGDKGPRVYYPNHELKQNLVLGTNRFAIEIIVCGSGHGGIQFEVGRASCKAWDEKMEEKCDYL